jgi:hypothetical protein
MALDQDRQAELEAIRADIRLSFPPETIIEALGSGRKPEDVVLSAAVLLVAELAPALLDAIELAATGVELSERQSALAFYGLHILGASRDSRAFPALMRILRLPEERLDPLLGDGLTQTIKRVAIGSFNGDADALFSLMADSEADEYARLEMFGVVAFLAFENRIDIAGVKRFLARFDDERLAPPLDMAWCGWEDAIALLGLRDFAPRVEAAWKDGRTPEGFSDPKYFFSDLKRAKTQWNDPQRFKDEHGLGYIEDIADELAWIDSGDSESGDTDARYEPNFWTPQTTYINPLRHIGRNDPCPCGSGKKAKRCCLAG